MNPRRIKWETSFRVTQIFVGITVAKWLDCHLASRTTTACRHGAFVRGSHILRVGLVLQFPRRHHRHAIQDVWGGDLKWLRAMNVNDRLSPNPVIVSLSILLFYIGACRRKKLYITRSAQQDSAKPHLPTICHHSTIMYTQLCFETINNLATVIMMP